MTLMTNKRPSYYMPGEKLAYARGWRHAWAGEASRPRSHPAAYVRGYGDAEKAASETRIAEASDTADRQRNPGRE